MKGKEGYQWRGSGGGGHSFFGAHHGEDTMGGSKKQGEMFGRRPKETPGAPKHV